MNTINTELISQKYREKAIDVNGKKLLITNYAGSQQEQDFKEPANCGGFGRIRHFTFGTDQVWPLNPLPIIPAQRKLGLPERENIDAQVFQNSVCNWRCWYCYVDFKLLNGDSRFSSLLSCEELLDLYQAEDNPPLIIDLSGGQPDLTPEWVVWMMDALLARGLDKSVFLWSDDNLSNDYFWRYLSNAQIDQIQSYEMYARVCCFKGIDETSFMINTSAQPHLFHHQFDLFKRLSDLNLDLYSYITLPAPSTTNFDLAIPKFLDRVQVIDEAVPLRMIPLRILEFTPSKARNGVDKDDLLKGQSIAIEVWKREIIRRFSKEQIDNTFYNIWDY